MEVDTRRGPAAAGTGPGPGDGPAPAVLAADTIEDYAVAVAVAVRHQPGAGWLPLLRPAGSRLPDLPFPVTSLHHHLTGPGVDLREWTDFQRLWLRWHAPLDHVPPMRWHLTAAWPGPGRPPAGLAEQVDGCMQALALTPPAERARLLAETLGRGSPDRAVLGWGDARWSLPAMLHARLTGRQFVWFASGDELLAAVTGGDVEALVVAPLEELGLDLVNALQEAHGFRAGPPRLAGVVFQSRPLSFFTARTLETLTRMVVKHDLYRRQPVGRAAWVFTGEMPGHDTDDDVTYLSQEEASAAHVELLESPDLLILAGHSREDLFHLGDDAICGRSVEADAGPLAPGGQRLPACVHDGRCVKAGRVLPVHLLAARAMSMSGCNLMRLGGGGNFPPEYTIAFSALEGPCNLVIASRRTRFGHAFEGILLHQLLRSGRTAGEAVRLLNNTLPLSGPESPDNLVLGDGDWRLYPDEDGGAAEVELEPAEGGWWLRATGVDAPLLQVRLPSLPGEISVRRAEDGPDGGDLFFSVAPEPDGGAWLFLFGWRRLVADELRIWVGSGPPASDQVAALRAAERNHVYGRLFRTYVPRFDNQERELRSLGVHVARRLGEARHRVGAAREAVRKAGEAAELLGRMDASVCAHLLERIGAGAFVWMEQYLEVDGSFEVAEQLAAETRCPYCASPVVRRVYRHVYAPEVARDFEICQTCGNIWDVPLGGVRPRFRGPETLPRGARVGQEVVLHNPHGHRVRGWLGFRLYQADRHGVRVTPDRTMVELAPGAETAVAFEIDVGERAPAHTEFLRGFWVGALDVSVFQRCVWVVPGERHGAGS